MMGKVTKIRREPQEYSNPEVIDLFLTETEHPAARQHLGELVVGLLESEEQDETRLEWRQRMMRLSVDALSMDSEELDAMLERDGALSAIFEQLQQSKPRRGEKLSDERRALLLLLDLRAGVVGRNESSLDSDSRWELLVKKLGATSTRSD